jgi:hypothetical protein
MPVRFAATAAWIVACAIAFPALAADPDPVPVPAPPIPFDEALGGFEKTNP